MSNDGISMLMITFRLDAEHRRRIAGCARRGLQRAEPLAAGHRSAGRAEAGPRRVADHVDGGVRRSRDTRELYVLADRYVKSIDRVGPRRRPGDDRRGRRIARFKSTSTPTKLAAHRTSIMQVHDAIASPKRRSSRRPRRRRLSRAEPADAGPVAEFARLQPARRFDGGQRAAADRRSGRARSTSRKNAVRSPCSTATGRGAPGAAAIG